MNQTRRIPPSAVNPPNRKGVSREVIELTAERLRVIAEPTRITLLQALIDGEAGVQELADYTGLTHQTASRHLALLYQAGVLGRKREVPTTRYVIADWSAWWVIEQIARWVQSCQEEQIE